MKPMTLGEIRQALGAAPGDPAADSTVVTAVTIDSRNVKKGDLFVAIPGERFDGHDFVAAALKAGCAGAIVKKGAASEDATSLIQVNDTIAALGMLGAHHRNLVKAKVVAITGSNGKTTTKRMLDHILGKHLRGTCSPKSFNNNIGVPLTLLGVAEHDEYVICEVGSNAPGEIAALSALARPDIAVIVSVGETHLEKLGSLEGVAAEKASMLGHLAAGGSAVVWADSPALAAATAACKPSRLVRFGLAKDADVRVTDVVGSAGGVSFTINGRVQVRLPLPGRHNAMNAAAAIAAAELLGIDVEASAAALADFAGVAMRLQSIKIGPLTVINDAYNANPTSMTAAGDVLADQDGARRVMVAGDMGELGPQGPSLHERVGRDIARRALAQGPARIDLLIGVGKLGRYIAKGAADNGLRTSTLESVEQATAVLPTLLSPGDVVLIKGSRTTAMERLIEPLQKSFGSR